MKKELLNQIIYKGRKYPKEIYHHNFGKCFWGLSKQALLIGCDFVSSIDAEFNPNRRLHLNYVSVPKKRLNVLDVKKTVVNNKSLIENRVSVPKKRLNVLDVKKTVVNSVPDALYSFYNINNESLIENKVSVKFMVKKYGLLRSVLNKLINKTKISYNGWKVIGGKVKNKPKVKLYNFSHKEYGTFNNISCPDIAKQFKGKTAYSTFTKLTLGYKTLISGWQLV